MSYVRDGNLFVVPVETGAASIVTQLTDVSAKRQEQKVTDSQKFLKEEAQKLIDFLRDQAEQKKRAEEKDKRHKAPAIELQERQSAVDLMLSPDDAHVFSAGGRTSGTREADDRAELRDRERLHRRHTRRDRMSATCRNGGCSPSSI